MSVAPQSTQVQDAIDVRNPGNGTLVGSVPVLSPEAVLDVVTGLRAEQVAWEALGPRQRARWLRIYRDWLLDNEAALVATVQAETGKPLAEAELEVMLICDVINYYSDRATKFLSTERIRPHGILTAVKVLRKVYRPQPVVGVITPWNFPMMIPGVDSVTALLAGAAVLIKPSEVTPLSAVALVRGWREIGAPDVFACVTGFGPTGAAVVDTVDMVQFTGSTATGRSIAVRAAQRLIPCCVELGGKDPALVLADANLERAANGIAWGGLLNAGQACVSVERVYVEAGVHDEFVALLTEKVRALRQGGDEQPFTADVGALANDGQLQIVKRQVADALERGATVAVGGSATGVGTYFEPTVITGVDHSMECVRDESFGPIIPVIKVADVDEAIRLANDSEYGLSATVWTGSRRRGLDVARKLEVGAVNVNDAVANLFCFGLPHGGWKTSGLGSRLGGAHGLRKYCRQQAITVPRVPTLTSELLWYPYSRKRATTVARVLRLLVARNPRRRTTNNFKTEGDLK
ncbi:MAG: aldehyde dehydrogenase [Marmoricola sp.]|nr:aldehyde dehydrogenase [Marmoricola sp.]